MTIYNKLLNKKEIEKEEKKDKERKRTSRHEGGIEEREEGKKSSIKESN